MTEFEKLDYEFRNQHMSVFNGNSNGLLWLKVRAICRSKQISQFTEENGISLKATKIAEQNIELFDILKKRENAIYILDRFLQNMNHEWYSEMGVDIDRLKEDLYQIQYYSWGGDQNNSLDKYFVSHYVKVISNYCELLNRQVEIGANAWNYVQNSWYNNWTSFIIESLFKCNPKVVSAVGEIKSVDFFIGNYPLDLKVTFFPNQFMEQKLKLELGKNTLAWLKLRCKEIGLSCNNNLSMSQQLYTLVEKLKEIDRNDIIEELDNVRRKIIEDARNNPVELITWLYENQGDMRFGAENRIYLILADLKDLSQSWKMKRAFSLIEPVVKKYLYDFTASSLKTVTFEFNKKTYTTLSDVIFIVK